MLLFLFVCMRLKDTQLHLFHSSCDLCLHIDVLITIGFARFISFCFFFLFFSLITFAFLNLFRILLFSSTVGCCFGCVISNGEILIRCRALNENWKNIFITKMSDTRWTVNTCAQWNCKLWNRVWYTENCEQIEIIFSYKKIVQRCLTKHVTIATDSLVLEFINLPVWFGV